MSQSYSKFNKFVQDIVQKVHNLASDTVTIALTDTLPTAANAVIADITQISYSNLSTRNLTLTSMTQSGGILSAIFQDLTLTASGTVPQFRYIVIYNSTAASGNLIGWYDYGAEVNMLNGDTFVIDLDNVNGIFQIQ